MTSTESADRRAIEAIIERQFASLNWRPDDAADWDAFAADFHSDAALYPSARPAKRQTVAAFVQRMQGLAASSMHTFQERVLGTNVQVFGNIAVALAGCEIVENDEKMTRSVEALLLVKDSGAWTIVAQTWDTERDGQTIPDYLQQTTYDRP